MLPPSSSCANSTRHQESCSDGSVAEKADFFGCGGERGGCNGRRGLPRLRPHGSRPAGAARAPPAGRRAAVRGRSGVRKGGREGPSVAPSVSHGGLNSPRERRGPRGGAGSFPPRGHGWTPPPCLQALSLPRCCRNLVFLCTGNLPIPHGWGEKIHGQEGSVKEAFPLLLAWHKPRISGQHLTEMSGYGHYQENSKTMKRRCEGKEPPRPPGLACAHKPDQCRGAAGSHHGGYKPCVPPARAGPWPVYGRRMCLGMSRSGVSPSRAGDILW